MFGCNFYVMYFFIILVAHYFLTTLTADLKRDFFFIKKIVKLACSYVANVNVIRIVQLSLFFKVYFITCFI